MCISTIVGQTMYIYIYMYYWTNNIVAMIAIVAIVAIIAIVGHYSYK